MKRRQMLFLSTVSIFLVVVGGYLLSTKDPSIFIRMVDGTATAIAFDPATLTKKYENKNYRFSVMMPEDFSAQEIPNDTGEGIAIVLQNNDGAGVQILLSPSNDEINTLTAEDIRSSVPDMKISEEQEVEIGKDYRGVAFKSNNEAFGGDSRDVWFIFRGTLYQITTYAKDDSLLQAMFTTWKFF